MLTPSYVDRDCIVTSYADGDCCCNCVNRYLLRVKGFPIGFVCKLHFYDSGEEHIMDLSWNGHSICEMHKRAKEIKIETKKEV
jgi:hypothetical protein